MDHLQLYHYIITEEMRGNADRVSQVGEAILTQIKYTRETSPAGAGCE